MVGSLSTNEFLYSQIGEIEHKQNRDGILGGCYIHKYRKNVNVNNIVFSTDINGFINAMNYAQDICKSISKFKVELTGEDIPKFDHFLISAKFCKEAIIPCEETVIIYGRFP